MRLFGSTSLLVASFLVGTTAVDAQQHNHASGPVREKLGTVSFPISCSPAVQTAFERGVALLHSFGYNDAAKQFREIEAKEPQCAMAYWGEAMSLYRQLWDRPSAADLTQGWQLVQKARAAAPKTARERGYIDAAAAFYTNDPKASYESRCDRYLQALEKLSEEYPNDTEATVFYALALIASPHADDHDLAYRKKAVARLTPIFTREPDHPGVAHYLIHACDNPQMAELGLPAARRYAQIAPDSPHALHMPSHIFARLGLWQEDIASNLASIAAAEQKSDVSARLHAMDFLAYAYLQTGRDDKADAVIKAALEVPRRAFEKGRDGRFYYVQVHFPSMFALETREWKNALALTYPTGSAPDFQAVTFWARAVAAGHLHDLEQARAAVANYDRSLEAVRKSSYSYVADEMSASRDEAHAWLLLAEGKSDTALALLDGVARKQSESGKGEVDLPAREMKADMLLALNRPQDAFNEYRRSLTTDPNRFNGLYGAARSAELSGEFEQAADYYRKLLANCTSQSQSERPELTEAKSFLSRSRN